MTEDKNYVCSRCKEIGDDSGYGECDTCGAITTFVTENEFDELFNKTPLDKLVCPNCGLSCLQGKFISYYDIDENGETDINSVDYSYSREDAICFYCKICGIEHDKLIKFGEYKAINRDKQIDEILK